MIIGQKRYLLSRASVVAGVLSVLLGSTVLVGWYAGSESLVQIRSEFVPMQYNTALGFLLSGVALLGMIYGKKGLAKVLGSFIAAVGLLTLSQYVFSIDLGIDQLLMEHYITVATSHPGRMAPNTALCFLLSGITIVVAVRTDHRRISDHVLGLAGSVVAALGFIALFGYASDLETAYGWGRLTQMAVHTSAGFIVVGLGLSLKALHDGIVRRQRLPRWLPFAFGVGVLTVSISLWQALQADFGDANSLLPSFVGIAGILAAMFLTLTVWMAQTALLRALQMAQANEELRKWELIFKHAGWGVVIADAQTHDLISVNPAFAEMHGYTVDEFQKINLADTFSEEDRKLLPERAKQVHENGFLFYESIHVRKDGSLFPVQTAVTAIYDEQGNAKFRAANYQDITERRRLEREKRKLDAHLRDLQRLESIGTLAGGVAHEINNPINGIMNYAQLISDRLDLESPLREFSDGIVEETERVAKIVSNLLTFARQNKQSHSRVRIVDIVNNAASLIGTIIAPDQIALEVDVPENLPQIKCHSQQIQQVLMNVLANARDALNARYPKPHADKTLKVTVRSFDKKGRDWLRITVEDHGIGIPDENRDKLFDPFFTTKDRTKGTGLAMVLRRTTMVSCLSSQKWIDTLVSTSTCPLTTTGPWARK